jgi:hypothetical protein
MLEILMRGVSTRNYKEVIPSMAETAGVSRSAVSRRVFTHFDAAVAYATISGVEALTDSLETAIDWSQ